MRLLLDTHIFIWWAEDPDSLSSTALSALEDESNELVLSIASAWEMQIKIQIGKLKLSRSLQGLIASQQQANDLQLLPVEFDHVLALGHLPLHHKDPFDRLIIAQAIAEGMTLVSVDTEFPAYPVKLLK